KTETPPAGSPGSVRVTGYAYHPTSLLKQLITPDNITLDYEYDGFGNPTGMSFTESAGAVYNTTYEYDDGDQVIRMTLPSGRIIDYTRDGVRRIDHTETLDDSGNILAGKPERELIYNDAGRLFRLIEDGIPRAEYRYNDQGLRTRKTLYQADGITIRSVTVYHYDPSGQLITETTETGDRIKDYIRFEGMTPLAQIDYNVSTNHETIQYLYTDDLQTPRLAMDQNRVVTWRWEGNAFGHTEPPSFWATIHFRFPGQYFDSETGLHYNYFRYYDSSIGRYITSDPIGLGGGLNTFAYVENNPLNWVDPMGLASSVLRTIQRF
ncbi:MAG: RHS repeat-associated core domain-containing protein, partial [Methylococcales bacterium]